MSVETFILGVESGLSALTSLTNRATFLGWSAQEKTGLHPAPPLDQWNPIQWNNLLNTTRKWAGSQDVGAQPGPRDVQAYLTEADGVNATVATFLEAVPGVLPNGYDALVNRLRHSLPAVFWGDTEIAQLSKWGTGGIWLPYVPLVGDSPMEELINRIFAATFDPATFDPAFATTYAPYIKAGVWQQLQDIKKAIAASGGGTEPVEPKIISLTITGVPGTATGTIS